MITTLSDWFIVLAPLFQSIRSETKTNRGSHVYIFPPFGSATCNYFEFWLVYWIDSVVLITLVLVLRHSIENRSNYLSQKNNWRAHFGMFSSWTALQFTETNYLLKKKCFHKEMFRMWWNTHVPTSFDRGNKWIARPTSSTLGQIFPRNVLLRTKSAVA